MRDIISHIKPHSNKRAFKKQSILLYQGEVPRFAYVMLDGVAKVYSINAAGEEQIVTFETHGDVFPAPWLFQKAATTLYYYEALTDVAVLVLPRAELHKLLAANHDLHHMLLEYFATRYTGLLMRVTALEQSRAREKIMFTLYYLMFRYGHRKKGGMYALGLKLTHSVIAALVGLTRETTTNELSKLKRDKILHYNAHHYSVDKLKLERALGEDSFENIEAIG